MNVQHRTVQDFLISGISDGLFREGEYLPAVDEIAERTRVSPHAVRRAVRQLGDRGILESTRNRGTRVLRKPPMGNALLMLSSDDHTNLLFQEQVSRALVGSRVDVSFLPFLFNDGAGFKTLRQLASKDACHTVLVTLSQECVPDGLRSEWERFAAAFRFRVGFQFEDRFLLPGSATVLPDRLAEAQLVAEHLLGLGHRRVAVMAGMEPGEGAAAERRAVALRDVLEKKGAECFLCYYDMATGGLASFMRQCRCTALWAINDHQAIGQIVELQRDGFRIPEAISVLGCNDTPWAAGGAVPVTTLSLNPPAVADAIRGAVCSAFDPAAGRAGPARATKHYIRPLLISRSSTGPAPA